MRGQGTWGRAAAPLLALGVLGTALVMVGRTTDGSLARTMARTLPGVVVADPDGPPVPRPWTLEPYTGLGAWVDVYDWSEEFADGRPAVGHDQIDAIAEAGVQTVFLQVGHDAAVSDRLEPDRLATLVERAHDRGMDVVGWYLPALTDPAKDLRRILVSRDLDLDGLAIDIESTDVDDVALRNERLLTLSDEVRAAVGDDAIGAITPSAVHLQVVNPAFWPTFPWPALAARYDAVLPMAYWSIRRGDLRAGERYIGENIDRVRLSTGVADIPIHPIGGIADGTAVPDLDGMVRAIEDRGVIGGSLYDWRTSTLEQWEALAPLADLR